MCPSYFLKKKAFTPQHLRYQMFFPLVLLVAFQRIKQFMLFVFMKKNPFNSCESLFFYLMRVFIGVRPSGVGGGG